MAKKKRKKRRARNRQAPRPTNLTRRLPQPQLSQPARDRLAQGDRYTPPPVKNPYVEQIIAAINEVSKVSGIPPHIILSDWIGMAEGALISEAENYRLMATEGRFVEDTPEYEEIFRKARQRYQAASAKYPAAYRAMQDAFSKSLALLQRAASTHSLNSYAGQDDYHPDLIGQVFVTFYPSPKWTQYFHHDWATAQAQAARLIPDPDTLLDSAVRESILYASDPQIEAFRAHDFESSDVGTLPWLRALSKFYQPPILTRGITSCGMLLAMAARFSDWVTQDGLVRFTWPEPGLDRLVTRMLNINLYLYGINGHTLQHIETALEIQDHLEHRLNEPLLIRAERDAPGLLYHSALQQQAEAETEQQPPQNETAPAQPVEDGPTFAELFRGNT